MMALDPMEHLGLALAETIRGTFRLGLWVSGLSGQQRARRRAAASARAAERESRQQQREWFEAVARQKARGHAGFAGEAEAREALSGKGGRPSNFDRRKF
jgi:hypothetical protein